VYGTLVFAASEPSSGYERWRSDGTSGGATRVQDIAPGSGNSNPGSFTVAGLHPFFAADDESHGRELWAISLTALGVKTAYMPMVRR
jgi:ELWxxDGT repeat protein